MQAVGRPHILDHSSHCYKAASDSGQERAVQGMYNLFPSRMESLSRLLQCLCWENEANPLHATFPSQTGWVLVDVMALVGGCCCAAGQ